MNRWAILECPYGTEADGRKPIRSAAGGSIAFTLTMLIGLAGIAMERDEWAELLVVVGMGCIWIFGSFWLARRMFIRVEVVSGYDE
jgi:hypothetical protein